MTIAIRVGLVDIMTRTHWRHDLKHESYHLDQLRTGLADGRGSLDGAIADVSSVMRQLETVRKHMEKEKARLNEKNIRS